MLLELQLQIANQSTKAQKLRTELNAYRIKPIKLANNIFIDNKI